VEDTPLGWFSAKITVTFIDDSMSEPFAAVEMPPSDLPETFELETTLHLGDADWSVISAEPKTRPEYSRSGKLTLRLRRIEQINPADIQFSLPSICDRLPAVRPDPADDACVLAEDDWRQFELVSRAFSAESDAEFASIRAIHEHERASVGWKKIHVRKRPDPPIASTLTLKDIDRVFGGVTFQSVSFNRYPVISGFSFRKGLQCYGTEEDGKVTVLGIVTERPEPSEALIQLAREFDLDLIHWCRCARASWDDPLFCQLLS
jgi:hypothetical protein